MKNNKLIFILTMLMCILFVTCSNPIMKEWWAGAESELSTESDQKSIFEREIELVKDIKVLYLNYIIFAPDSIYYNAPAHPSGVDLTSARKALNDTIVGEVKYITDQLSATQATLKVLVNGYSNPAIPPTDPNWENEVIDCQWVSNARAEEVAGELIFIGVDHNLITYNGYGGTQTIVTYNPNNLASAELNRRVEVIIIEIVQ